MKGYTTIEQSKQLVSVGLDPNTADMCYRELISEGKVYYNPKEAVLTPYSQAFEYKQRLEKELAPANMEIIPGTVYEITPCWSLNALIELFPKDKNAPVFTLTRCGKNPMTGKHDDEWYAEWETFETYIVLHNENAVDAVVELIVKLINDKRVKL